MTIQTNRIDWMYLISSIEKKRMIISFSITSKRAKELGIKDPLFQGIKTVTRRNWSTRTWNSITKSWDREIRQHHVWSNVPFVSGSTRLGVIDLTCRPYLEKLQDIPDEDIYHEGNLWKSKTEFIECLGISPNSVLTVVRFHFTPVINP
jgi:hypothetical protein